MAQGKVLSKEVINPAGSVIRKKLTKGNSLCYNEKNCKR